MPRRLALLILGFALCFGAFFIYQVINGQKQLGGNRPAPLVVTTRDNKPLTFESRSSTGELRYVITAQSMDEQKNPGQFLLHNPVAIFYTHDGRTISIRGDTCEVAVDQIRHINSSAEGGGAGGGGEPPSVRDGKLHGNIVLTVAGKIDPNDPTKDPGDIIVRFEKDLELNGTEQELTSPGKVQVRSNVVVFDGEGFTLNYSMDKARADNQRVEFLKIEKGNKIILKNKGAKAFDLDNTKSSTTKPASTQPVNPADQPTTYKLSFGRDITATHGQTVLTADQLFVLFTAPSNREVIHDVNNPAPDTEPSPKPRGGRADAATQAGVVATTHPLPPADPMGEPGPDDLVITWVGSMQMQPWDSPDVQMVDSKDIALEAVGTPERPVKISEPKRSVEAGKLWYHKADQSLELQPLAGNTVKFTVIGNNTNEATKAECQGVSVALDEKGQTARHARLMGPGTFSAPSALSKKETSSTPLVATWSDTLDVDLDTVADPKNPKRVEQHARHIVMSGTSIKDADFSLTADNLDLLIANVQGSSPALEHLLATGNVRAESYKKSTSGLEAKRLEVLTAMYPSSKTPLPTKVLADGNVSAWQYAEKKATATAPAIEGAIATGPEYRKETVFGPHLEADLAPKSKQSAAAESQPADSAINEFAVVGPNGGGGSVDVKHFLINGGIRVTIESNKGEPPVNVDADSLDAHLPLATLSGKDANHPVHITRGKDDITGAVVLLDQSKQTFTIPGPGHFAFIPPEKKGKQQTPMDITWTKQMAYDQKARIASFTGEIDAQSIGKAAEPAFLKCDKILEVKLKPATDKTTDNADLETAGAGGLDAITAEGHVVSRATQLDDNGKILTDMNLLDVEKLTYNGTTQTLDIPGSGTLTLTDFRPEKQQKSPDAQSSRGTTAFKWAKEFSYDTNNGVITFTKDVQMAYLPLKPFKLDVGNLGQSNPAAPPKQPSLVRLDTQLLKATLVKSKDASPDNATVSPVGLGAGGNFRLASVVAGGIDGQGGTSIKTDEFLLTGYTVGMEVDKNLVIVDSSENVPASVTRIGRAMAEADQIIWDLTKNKEAFSFTLPRASIEGMSDIEGETPQN